LDLRDGEIHAVDEDSPSDYHKILFDSHTIRIADIGSDLVRSEKKSRGDRELSADDMKERVAAYRKEIEDARESARGPVREQVARSLASLRDAAALERPGRRLPDAIAWKNVGRDIQNATSRLSPLSGTIRDRNKSIDRYLVEIHKKYALPVACIVFVLVGAPLGVKAHRGGLGVGAGFSIAFFVVYYLFLIGGEKLADRGYLPPAVAMWAANVLMGALGVHMLVRLTRETTFFRLPRFARATGKRA
jgi:lipopolysaccharide export system permease protein